jgi:hypothetical protein
MPKPQSGPNRHQFRIWLKMVIRSGLIDMLPPRYELEGRDRPQDTEVYARRLMSELQDPDASGRPIKEIVADVRRFQSWVEAHRKADRRRALADRRPEDRIIALPPGRPEAPADRDGGPRPASPRTRRTSPPDTSPQLHPMWDDWIDSLER